MSSPKTSGTQAALLAASLAGEGRKPEATIRQAIMSPIALATAVIAVLMALLVAAPQAAHATESLYCSGAKVAPKQYCNGTARTFNAEYGTGDQGSVCVGSGVGGAACSGGPGQGVYKPVGQWIYAEPWIFNNLPGQSNVVHGVAFTP